MPKNLRVSKPEDSSSTNGHTTVIQSQPSPQDEPRINLDKEMDAFKKISTGEDAQTRLILVTGEGGMGKSYLLSLYKRTAEINNLDVIVFGLGPQISIEQCLDQIVGQFGCSHFNYYDEFLREKPHESFPPQQEDAWQRNLTRQFFKDLSNYITASPVLIFFDQYEKADQLLKNWLTQIFLPHISVHYPIIVVISGLESIEPLPSEKGCQRFPLKGVNVHCYHRYVEDCKVELDSKVINAIYDVFKGRPKDFVEFVNSQRSKGAAQ